MTKEEAKSLLPSQWKALAFYVYEKECERRGVKFCRRHWYRLENGLIATVAREWHFGRGVGGDRPMVNHVAETLWWFSEVFVESITKDFILFEILK